VDENRVQLDGGIEYGRWGEVRLGVYRSRVHAEVDTGPPALPTDFTVGSLVVAMVVASAVLFAANMVYKRWKL